MEARGEEHGADVEGREEPELAVGRGSSRGRETCGEEKERERVRLGKKD